MNLPDKPSESVRQRNPRLFSAAEISSPRGVKSAHCERGAKKSGYSVKVVKAWFVSQGLPEAVSEYRFTDERKFRFDFAFVRHKVAVECEGGIFSGGSHGRASGIMRDIEKYNLAATLGWRVLRCTPQTLCTVAFAETIKRALAASVELKRSAVI